MLPWFSARLLFVARDKDGKVHLAEESIRIFRAESLLDAEKVAEARYRDARKGDIVTVGDVECAWELRTILDIFDIAYEPDIDVEVCSVLLEPEEADILLGLFERISEGS